MEMSCKIHGETTWYTNKNGTGRRCRKCMVDNVNKRRRKVKLMAVEYKGGKCQICQYDKCVDALDFHHLDSSQKDFGLAEKGHCRSWEVVKKELDKCVCICANCHRELHSGLIKLEM